VNQQHDLEEFLIEAAKVRAMADSEGWQVIRRDCEFTIESYKKQILSMDKNDPKFDETRLQAMACEKLISIVDDYEVNRKKAEELFLKSKLPEEFIMADVDNHSPLIEQD